MGLSDFHMAAMLLCCWEVLWWNALSFFGGLSPPKLVPSLCWSKEEFFFGFSWSSLELNKNYNHSKVGAFSSKQPSSSNGPFSTWSVLLVVSEAPISPSLPVALHPTAGCIPKGAILCIHVVQHHVIQFLEMICHHGFREKKLISRMGKINNLFCLRTLGGNTD